MSVRPSAAQIKLKYVATINDESLDEDIDPDYEIQYVDIGGVDASGRIGDFAAYRFEEAPSRARRRVQDGDVIISTVRTYLQAIAQIRNPPKNLIVSTGFAVVRPRRERLAANYSKHLLREPSFLAEVERRSVGVSYPAISASDLAGIPVHVHHLPHQRTIADYLDRETARIDALIAAKERLLRLLAEKRRSFITRAVTRGLDPDVSLRDSGIPWLGEIPAHWGINRLKHIGKPIIGLTFDPADTVNDGRGVLVLRASNVQNQRIVLDDNIYVLMEVHRELITRIGDILICSRSGSPALIGKSAQIDEASADLTFGTFMTLFRSQYNDYLFFIFNSPIFDYQAGAYSTSTINQLTIETLKNLAVPTPPPEEQQAIVEYLRSQTPKFDQLIEKTSRTVALLSERRATLIAGAVTGKIDVGSAA